MGWNSVPDIAFGTIFGLYILGVLLSLLLRHARAATIAAATCVAFGGLAALTDGIGVLSGAPAPYAALDTGLPFGALSLHLDMLSAFFLAVIGLISLPIAIYSVGYLRHEDGRRVSTFGVLLNLLLLALVCIVAASDMIVFLLGWEAMAFLSYMLVNFHYEDRQVIRSGYVMLAVSEIGTIGILIAFLLLFQAAGSFGFAALRVAAGTLSMPLRSAVFVLALVGFGAKIGLLPLQVWMPDAYKDAPDHISALLSAVLINLGIYGIMRFLFDFLGSHGNIPLWWGLLLISIGSITALVGILYSILQQNLKQVLAYSSVENMGILLAGMGAALIFLSYHLLALAALATIVTLYHMLNHSVFKGLLFLGAGAVHRATGTTDLAKLGGLLRLMPWTGLFFIVAALSISAVPPFNGYISEWMLLETLLQSFAIPGFTILNTMTKVIMAFSGGMLALTAGIAVTAFVRATGITFLALPRSQEAAKAQEAPGSMRVAMGFLALLCLALGVLPTFVLPLIDRVTTPLIGQSVINQIVPPLFTPHPGSYALLVTLGGGLFAGLFPINGLVVIAAPAFSTIDSPSYLFLAELLLIALVLLALKVIRPLGARRRGRVWAGGIPRFTSAMTYSGLSYSNPVRIIFNSLYRSRARSESQALAARYREGRIVYEQEIPPPFERNLYRPLLRSFAWVTRGARFIQSGNINQYVFYIFCIVVSVMIILILRAI
jgi:hydrogenase-4 component B